MLCTGINAVSEGVSNVQPANLV